MAENKSVVNRRVRRHRKSVKKNRQSDRDAPLTGETNSKLLLQQAFFI